MTVNQKVFEKEICSTDGCGIPVYNCEIAFATPCGTFCTRHFIEDHLEHCGICQEEYYGEYYLGPEEDDDDWKDDGRLRGMDLED